MPAATEVIVALLSRVVAGAKETLPPGTVVPNDARLGPGHGRLWLITGPNLFGKSTFIRQVALLTLMAQTGSFVPAKRARIGIADRIFTRVGASDERL